MRLIGAAIAILILPSVVAAQTPAPAIAEKPLATLDQRLRHLAGLEDLSATVNYGGRAMVIQWLLVHGYMKSPIDSVPAAAAAAEAALHPAH